MWCTDGDWMQRIKPGSKMLYDNKVNSMPEILGQLKHMLKGQWLGKKFNNSHPPLNAIQ